jgi:hypothetical protein
MNLKSAEKMFFGQKLKCSFFKDCDRGSKFFHALMSHKHRRNFIPVIQRSNNLLTTSLEVVGEEFVNYYQQLLGSSKDMIPIDLEVIHSGSCLATSAHDLLLAPVTSAEIKKKVLFGIGNDKAPGPDGYSSFLFKQSWDVVGADFSAAVQDFFILGELLKQINHSVIALVPKSANITSTLDFQTHFLL